MSKIDMTVATLYRCPVCENEYPSVEEAEACRKTPYVPKDTKWATRDSFTAEDHLYAVRNVEGGCHQELSLKPHPDFWSSMKAGISRELKSGYCLIQKKPKPTAWRDRSIVPLTLEVAENSLKGLAAKRERLKKQDREYAKREEVLRKALAELPAPAPD